MSATLGNVSKSFTLKDYLMYWTPNLKKNVDPTTIQYTGKFNESTSGLAMSGTANSQFQLVAQSLNCSMEFDIASISTPQWMIGTTDHLFLYPSLKIIDHVKIVLEDGNQKLYVNDALISTVANEVGGNWQFKLPSNVTGSHSIRINNLKIKRL